VRERSGRKNGKRRPYEVSALTASCSYRRWLRDHEGGMDTPGRSHVQPKLRPQNTQLHCDPIETSARNHCPPCFKNHISRRTADTNIFGSRANVESRAALVNNDMKWLFAVELHAVKTLSRRVNRLERLTFRRKLNQSERHPRSKLLRKPL
jgi:hypothetical protein